MTTEKKDSEMHVAVSEKPINGHLQMMPIAQAQAWYNEFVNFSRSILKQDLDYGIIPGTPKPSLYKPGAEKLRFVYGLGAEFECIEKVVDLDRPFVDYSYKCSIISKTGQILAQCEGNCNSMEAKFGYLWKTAAELPEGTDTSKLVSKTTGKKATEFDFAINKSETTGQYGKPQQYWDNWKAAIESGKAKKVIKKAKSGREMEAWELDDIVIVYRITNPDVVGMKNTIMKMAQKRAFVGAILIATGASEFFTQDIEDMDLNGRIHTNEQPTEYTEATIVDEVPETPVVNRIPGHWYAKLERCKTPEAIDELSLLHKDTIVANPELRKLFVETKEALRKKSQEVIS